MKIFLTSGDNPYQKQVGGKHIHQLLFERALKEIGHQVDTFYPIFPKRKKIQTALNLLSHLLPLNSYGFLEYRLKVDAKRLFSKCKIEPLNQYDILHAQDPISLLYTQNITCKKRILTLHGYFTKESINYSKLSEDSIPKFTKWSIEIERKAYELADFIVCVDTTIKNYLITELSIPEKKISVVFNAIDVERFSPPSPEDIEKLRTKYGFEKNKYLILVPRRLVMKNGVHVAIQAMKKIKDENTSLLIAGDGPERKSVEELAMGDRRVHFLGSVDHSQIIDYFKMANCILIPSITSNGFQEATSLAMLEGMSMCKPTVCSAIGGMKEVIKHNETGFLVEEQNPLAIAEQIAWIQANPHKTNAITSDARKYIMENHHYLSHAKKIVNFY